MKKPKKLYGENITKYGEFVCSTFHWLPLEKQKEQTERFEHMTQEEGKNKL